MSFIPKKEKKNLSEIPESPEHDGDFQRNVKVNRHTEKCYSFSQIKNQQHLNNFPAVCNSFYPLIRFSKI